VVWQGRCNQPIDCRWHICLASRSQMARCQVQGSMLRCVGKAVQEQLGSVASAVGAELEAIQSGLQRRADIAAARAMLELMQDTAHVMSKVQSCVRCQLLIVNERCACPHEHAFPMSRNRHECAEQLQHGGPWPCKISCTCNAGRSRSCWMRWRRQMAERQQEAAAAPRRIWTRACGLMSALPAR
jgi:hypothetical protein